jgi:hypothetical protein
MFAMIFLPKPPGEQPQTTGGNGLRSAALNSYLGRTPCYGSGGYLSASHHGGPGSRLGQFRLYLSWTKSTVRGFSLSCSVYPCQYHSTVALHAKISSVR